MADKLMRVVFVAPVLDPGGRGATTSSSFHDEGYELALERSTGLVRITSRKTGRSAEAYVECSFELAPLPTVVVDQAPAKRAAKGK